MLPLPFALKPVPCQVQPRLSETYTFHTLSDDGVRLWVNGNRVINQWTADRDFPTIAAATAAGSGDNSGGIALSPNVS